MCPWSRADANFCPLKVFSEDLTCILPFATMDEHKKYLAERLFTEDKTVGDPLNYLI